MKSISSPHNPLLKRIARLQRQPQHYREEGVALLSGVHLLAEWLAHGQAQHALAALLLDEAALADAEVKSLLSSIDGRVIYISTKKYLGESVESHTSINVQALIHVAAQPQEALAPAEPTLLLDAVQDAGNVGSLLRTAAAAGLRQAVLGKGCAAAYSPKVLRAAMGAHFHLQVFEQADLAQTIARLAVPVYAADVSATLSVFDAVVRQPCAWLMGNEGAGIAAPLLGLCTQRLRIPQRGPQSLNVGAAAAVCLFESLRQSAGA